MPRLKKDIKIGDGPEPSKQMKEILSSSSIDSPEKKKRGRPKKNDSETSVNEIKIKKTSDIPESRKKVENVESEINIDELFEVTLGAPQKPFEYSVSHETLEVTQND